MPSYDNVRVSRPFHNTEEAENRQVSPSGEKKERVNRILPPRESHKKPPQKRKVRRVRVLYPPQTQ